VSEFQIVDTVA